MHYLFVGLVKNDSPVAQNRRHPPATPHTPHEATASKLTNR
jgi:hypothetical protein